MWMATIPQNSTLQSYLYYLWFDNIIGNWLSYKVWNNRRGRLQTGCNCATFLIRVRSGILPVRNVSELLQRIICVMLMYSSFYCVNHVFVGSLFSFRYNHPFFIYQHSHLGQSDRKRIFQNEYCWFIHRMEMKIFAAFLLVLIWIWFKTAKCLMKRSSRVRTL